MHTRVQIVVRNPGFEGTEQALGAHTLDFEDAQHADVALQELRLRLTDRVLRRTIILTNEKGEQLGFNPEFYVSHWVSDVDNWAAPAWTLPPEGNPKPDREQ